jgi:endonuclease YncB( thermonuclease family)
MSDFRPRWRRQRVRWKPSGRRVDWQAPVIFGLLSFAVVLAVMIVIDKTPSLLSSFRRYSTVSLSAVNPSTSRVPTMGISRIIDGDTVVATGGQHYRLVGFDTPEKGDLARCDSERQLAARATARQNQLITGGDARLTRVACACRSGTEGTRRCNFGRLCGTITANGRDVGDILISEGLAHRYVCSVTRCPRRPGWC